MSAPTYLLRGAAILGTTALVALGPVGTVAPASAATSGDGVEVVNTETVQVYLTPDGRIDSKRVYEQLALTGKGEVDLANPISTDGLRNLDGFGGFTVRDGEQIVDTTVDGTKKLRSVSTFTGDLPLDVQVGYLLDGEEVEPGDVVGKSGRLEVRFKVTNVTTQPQELSFDDGRGGTVTRTVDVPVPMVGSVTTDAPESFTNVRSEQANMAGDGKGGTTLSFTMTLFPPIGSTTAEFGYSADITDGVVPRVEISALPVNPLESPTFATAAKSYQGGADTGAQLVDGAVRIDSNLLKLRDGAAELLAGLIKLNAGAAQLNEGLAGSAAPGSRELATGAGDLDAGLGRLEDGSAKLRAGLGTLAAGTGKLDRGAGRLSAGAKKLSTGADSAAAGGRKLTTGLKQISGGLGQLDSQLPAASEGIKKLKAGIDQLSAAFGDPSNERSLIGGLTKLTAGLGALNAKAPELAGSLKLLRDGDGTPANAGLKGAQGAVDFANGQLDAGQIGGWAVRVGAIKALCGGACDTAADELISEIGAEATAVGTAKAYLTNVSAGLGAAISGLDAKLAPGADVDQLVGGVAALKKGADDLLAGATTAKAGAQQLGAGLDELAKGVTAAVAGVSQLNTGAASALTGSSDLTKGLGRLSTGAGDLAAGSKDLAAGAGKVDAGTGELRSGAGRLASGTSEAHAGSGRLATGADELADGLGTAADGSGRLADGLAEAANAAPRLPEGAQRLSAEGTKKLVSAGEETTQTYGEMVAVLNAGAERAQTADMAYGAPADAIGLTAYSYVLTGADGEGDRNLTRTLGGVAMLAAAAGVLALRRRKV